MVELTTAKYSEASSGQHLPTPREVWFPRGRTRYEWAAKFSIRWSPTHSRSAHDIKEPGESSFERDRSRPRQRAHDLALLLLGQYPECFASVLRFSIEMEQKMERFDYYIRTLSKKTTLRKI